MLALAAAAPAHPVFATEPKGDLDLQLRLVETVPGRGPAGPSMAGVARIEVQVEAHRATAGVELRVLRPDGSAWTVKSRPYATRELAWTDAGGRPLENGAVGQSIPARGAMRTMIAVPLEGAAVHEIVVNVSGSAGGDPIATEGIVRAVLGVADAQPVDDGTYANVPLNEVK